MTINDILSDAIKVNASDVHLFVGLPPIFRVNGELSPSKRDIISEETLKELVFPKLNEKQKTIFEQKKDLDFSYAFIPDYDFRLNIHYGCGQLAANIRILPQRVKTREELLLPPVVDELARKRQGLIVISGRAGSGKSTTMTYILDLINRERKCKIITIEDPVEFHHKSKQSYILQREVGADTISFASALKYALRQDPDVVVIGEMRDHESISMALTTAETGHLVLTTVHAPDAIETINRVVDVYPIGHREQVLVQLARNLLGVVSQTLIPQKNKKELLLATEILTSTIAVQNLIRRGALLEMRGLMDADHTSGMHSLEWFLVEKMCEGVITEQTANEFANYTHNLEHFKQSRQAKLNYGIQTMDPMLKKAAGRKLQKLLVIDSNDYTRVSTVLKLNSLGYGKVFFSITGTQGLEIIKREKPDIIVVDEFINDWNSFDLCREIRAHSEHDKKIIMLSNEMITSRSLKAARDNGINDLVNSSPDHHFLLMALGVDADEGKETRPPASDT